MAKETKKYVVNFDMRWSHDIPVTGKTAREAKKKAVARFLKSVKPSMFHINVDTV